MNNWHLIPWTLQYTISGISIIIISSVIFSRNRESLAYQNFFSYGLCTAIWVIMAFFHRNAPNVELSHLFLRIDLFFVSISWVFLPLTILCIWRERKAYLWVGLPALFVGIYILVMAPSEIYWSNFGWSFKFTGGFGNVFTSIYILYMFLLCGAFIQLTRRISSKMLAKKYLFVLIGYLFFYAIGMTITILSIQRDPNFPPFGGILTLIQFLFIAYAVTLRPEKIIPYSELKEPISALSQSYIAFLNRFQAKMPGKELGESSFRFQDYIEAMGLEGILVFKSGTLVFEVDKLTGENIREAPDNILRVMKEHPWAATITRDFVPILLRTFKLLQPQSESGANEWRRKILQNHGGFLLKHDMLTELSKDAQLPAVFTELRPGQVYLFKEDSPKKAYGMLKEAESYGIESLCITKLSPETIGKNYGIREASILWVTFEKTETTITPKDIAGLTKNVSEFSMKPDGTIILLDCFDQLKFANGFEKSVDILKILRALSMENDSILFTSIPPMMFEKEELFTIEKELKEGVQQ